MIEVARNRFGHLLAQGAALGSYDEVPLIPRKVDPQLYLSRNDQPQPFYLVCERDTVLATLSGSGRIAFARTAISEYRVGPGDYVYVPARVPHSIRPAEPMIQVRYKAEDAGLEAAAWFCAACDAEVWRYQFDTNEQISQAGWQLAAETFNSDPGLRTCECGEVHPPADLAGTRWREVAAGIAAEAENDTAADDG